jgi:predicted transcriptional regulator
MKRQRKSKMAQKHDDHKVDQKDILAATAVIVAGYVTHHSVKQQDLKLLVRDVHGILNEVALEQHHKRVKPIPAVEIEKSVFPEYIICLEDGKKLKMLKRYLKTTYSMTPEEYRLKWGLPHDYPMVAPRYAAKRSALAKEIGLGVNR